MTKLVLTVAAVLAVVCASFAPSLAARVQVSARFEYVRVTPYQSRLNNFRTSPARSGYRACVASTTEPVCREFYGIAATGVAPANDAFSETMATLGDEGWELVSVVDEAIAGNTPYLTYLFKRRAQ